MRSSLPTRVLAVVIVVALVAVFTAPVQAAGTPDVARSSTFVWLSHSLFDWVGALLGIDLSVPEAPRADSGVRSITETIRITSEPDGTSDLSSDPTATPTLSSGGSNS